MEKWIDLTVLIDEFYKAYPGDIPLSLETEKSVIKDGYNLNRININMHVGTHLDAKKHMFDVSDGIEAIDINKLIGSGIVIKPRIKDHIINTEDIIDQYDGTTKILLLNLGFAKKFNTDEYYSPPKFRKDFLDFVLANNIEVIGFDIPSPEYESGNQLDLHRDLLGENIIIIENLCNLDKLSKDFQFIGLPLKIKGLDGSMIRCVAKNK
ncbi:cyclase family protein [Mycoplasmatota bacterium WC30]